MHIGQVARRAGVPAHTIRFYEDRRLITKPARSQAGYRLYQEHVIDELGFIRRAQRLGFSLDEVGELLSLSRGGQTPCAKIAALCAAHLEEIERQMAELRSFRRSLIAARRRAQAGCGFTRAGFCTVVMGDKGAAS